MNNHGLSPIAHPSRAVRPVPFPVAAALVMLAVWGVCIPVAAQEITIDNDDGAPAYTESGSWTTSGSTGYLAGTYRVASAGAASVATWNASLPDAGPYSVFVVYRAGSNRVDSAKYIVVPPAGPQTIFVNQQTNDLTWVRLGTWTFDAGSASVQLDAAGSSGGLVVIADAVKFVFAGGTPTPTPSPTPVPTMQELRGLWVTAWGPGFKTADQVAELVAVARDHHYNAIFAEVRKRADAYYFPTPPNLEPRATDIAPDFDPLQELIDQAHAYGIEVHAWIVTYNIADATTSLSLQNVANVHPDYLMKNSEGDIRMGNAYYLDPGNPAANRWNHNVVMDLVAHYDIDGIHFDYFRYPGQDAGYNDAAIARYNAEYGWPGLNVSPAPSDPLFSAWRRRQITDWLRATYVDIMAVKPSIKVTAAVFANESSAHDGVFQDWKDWMARHLLDAVCPMNYTDDFATFHARAEFANSVKNGHHCYMGQAATMNSLADTEAQMLDARAMGCDGILTYQYLATNNGGLPNADFYNAIRDTVYSEPAAVPEMPWKTRPTGGYIRGTVTEASTNTPLYNATVSIDALSTSALTDPDGRFAFVYIPAGTYTLHAETDGYNPEDTTGVIVTAGNVTTVDFSLDVNPNPTPTPTFVSDVIIDNDDGPPGYLETGSWTTSSSTGYNGLTYRYAPTGKNAYARWDAYLEAGVYDISVIYRASPNRSPSASFITSTASGNQTTTVDQTQHNLEWVLLGQYTLLPGYNSVTLSAGDSGTTGTFVIADAVHFQKVAEPPPSPTPTPSPTPAGFTRLWTVH